MIKIGDDMPNSINVKITEDGAQCILSNYYRDNTVSIESARTFLWRQKDRLELATTRLSSLAIRVMAYKDKLINRDEHPDAVEELLRATRALTNLAGHNPQASLAALQYQFNELSRAADKVQLQQDWVYGI